MTIQEKRRIWRNNWRNRNPEKWKECCRRYVLKNKDKISLYEKSKARKLQKLSHFKYRRRRDINFKLSGNLRSRLNESLKNNVKNGSSVNDLGCSIPDFKKYIESKWLIGMCWENYGRNGWHLDHIIPLSTFNLSDRNQLLKACHYTNYQPLWSKDNIRKGCKL